MEDKFVFNYAILDAARKCAQIATVYCAEDRENWIEIPYFSREYLGKYKISGKWYCREWNLYEDTDVYDSSGNVECTIKTPIESAGYIDVEWQPNLLQAH